MNNEEQIVRTLAEREGWTTVRPLVGVPGFSGVFEAAGPYYQDLPDYLHSRDALALVMEKMTPEEWDKLNDALCFAHLSDLASRSTKSIRPVQFYLTLPPATLARLVAEAIVACGEAPTSKGGLIKTPAKDSLGRKVPKPLKAKECRHLTHDDYKLHGTE